MAEPDWLVQLRAAIFATDGFAETDDAFMVEGIPYVCRRTLTEDAARVIFREVWLDPQTYQQKKAWQQDIQAGAFVGVMPPEVFTQQVAFLTRGLAALRPRTVARTRTPAFTPERFAHLSRERRRV